VTSLHADDRHASPPSRTGKRQITIWIAPEAVKQLKHLALDEEPKSEFGEIARSAEKAPRGMGFA
jgi:hypothetical protein